MNSYGLPFMARTGKDKLGWLALVRTNVGRQNICLCLVVVSTSLGRRKQYLFPGELSALIHYVGMTDGRTSYG